MELKDESSDSDELVPGLARKVMQRNMMIVNSGLDSLQARHSTNGVKSGLDSHPARHSTNRVNSGLAAFRLATALME